jgi:hypothetical protein
LGALRFSSDGTTLHVAGPSFVQREQALLDSGHTERFQQATALGAASLVFSGSNPDSDRPRPGSTPARRSGRRPPTRRSSTPTSRRSTSPNAPRSWGTGDAAADLEPHKASPASLLPDTHRRQHQPAAPLDRHHESHLRDSADRRGARRDVRFRSAPSR